MIKIMLKSLYKNDTTHDTTYKAMIINGSSYFFERFWATHDTMNDTVNDTDDDTADDTQSNK